MRRLLAQCKGSPAGLTRDATRGQQNSVGLYQTLGWKVSGHSGLFLWQAARGLIILLLKCFFSFFFLLHLLSLLLCFLFFSFPPSHLVSSPALVPPSPRDSTSASAALNLNANDALQSLTPPRPPLPPAAQPSPPPSSLLPSFLFPSFFSSPPLNFA